MCHSVAGTHQAGYGREPTYSRRSTGYPRSLTSPADPKGDGLKQQIEAGKYPGIVKTTLDGVDQRDYLEGKSERVGARAFFYYTGCDTVGGAVQKLEDVLTR